MLGRLAVGIPGDRPLFFLACETGPVDGGCRVRTNRHGVGGWQGRRFSMFRWLAHLPPVRSRWVAAIILSLPLFIWACSA